ncbi:MAG: hypothetical protein R2824_20490 [Saprospiraceae bacterium]|nr:hypothetical protein [Lewinella sp.]
MKKQSLLFSFLLLSVMLFGQTQTTYSETDLRDLASLSPNTPGVRSIDLRYEGIKGTPFMSEEWQKGSFQLKGKDEFSQDISVQLNLVEQTLYFQLNNGFTAILPTAKLQALRINTDGDNARLFRVYAENEIEGGSDSKLKFYEVLFEGPFLLLKQHYKVFREADFKGAYSSDRRYDEYVDQSNLWLQEAGKPFQKVKLKKKNIEDALPGYTDEIQKVMKSEKISLREDIDLVQLLTALQNKE